MLTLTVLYYLFFGGNDATTKPEIIEVPDCINLSDSIFYGGENPRYIYKEDIEELDRLASSYYQDVEVVYVEY